MGTNNATNANAGHPAFDRESRFSGAGGASPQQIVDQIQQVVKTALPSMESQVQTWCQEGNTEYLALYGILTALDRQLGTIPTGVH